MIQASISFFIIGLVAFVLGAYGIAGLSIELGKVLLIAFFLLAVVSYVISMVTGKNPKTLP